MAEITTILLVPAEGDPKGLLAEGLWGARPPVAVRAGGKWVPITQVVCQPWSMFNWEDGSRALVLAYDGKPVPEGLDRVLRAHGAHPRHDYSDIGALAHAKAAGAARMGTLICLDSDGNEVKHG